VGGAERKIMNWQRHRFHANDADPRPVTFPPPGPYWISGYGDDYAIVVAFLPSDVEVTSLWPEASNIDTDDVDGITFTSRFPEPDWWRAQSTPQLMP
jgi:hypothetical protein